MPLLNGKSSQGSKPDNLVVAHAQLNSALLPAETAVRLDQLSHPADADPAARWNGMKGGPELLDEFRDIAGEFCHISS